MDSGDRFLYGVLCAMLFFSGCAIGASVGDDVAIDNVKKCTLAVEAPNNTRADTLATILADNNCKEIFGKLTAPVAKRPY